MVYTKLERAPEMSCVCNTWFLDLNGMLSFDTLHYLRLNFCQFFSTMNIPNQELSSVYYFVYLFHYGSKLFLTQLTKEFGGKLGVILMEGA